MGNQLISKKTNIGIKGWMCICILVHHLYQFTGLFLHTYFGHFLNLLGSWAVAVFLFLSGYGLYCSYSEKGPEYVKGFLKKRFLPLYIIYAIAVLIYFIYDFGPSMTVTTVLRSLTWGGTIVSFGWFFQMLFVLYLMFYLSFRFINNKYVKSAIIGGFSIIYLIVAHLYGQYDYPIFAFLFGLIVAVHRNALVKSVEKKALYYIILSFMTFFSMYLIYVFGVIMGKFTVGPFFLNTILCISDLGIIVFVVTLAFLCERKNVPLFVNPITNIISKFSLEVYILQGLILRLFTPYINNLPLYILLVLLSLTVLAVIYHYFNQLIKNLLTKCFKA
ncbi:MAG: acyltransferase family protein [Lachnospiraceae bacterium]|nr:acyltransferase family protein [Lachnospiraceae bacterium]